MTRMRSLLRSLSGHGRDCRWFRTWKRRLSGAVEDVREMMRRALMLLLYGACEQYAVLVLVWVLHLEADSRAERETEGSGEGRRGFRGSVGRSRGQIASQPCLQPGGKHQ